MGTRVVDMTGGQSLIVELEERGASIGYKGLQGDYNLHRMNRLRNLKQ